MMKEETKRWLDEQFGGESETIALVWSEYLGETTAKLAALRAALAADDYPLLDRLAHTLKGNALMVGDQPMVSAAVVLRDASKSSDADGVAAAIGRIVAIDGENRA